MAVLVVRLVDESAGFLAPGSLESFRSGLHLSYAQAAIVLAMGAPGALTGTVFSAAADHYSRRVISSGGAVGFSVALATFAAGRSFVVLAGASFVIGAAATAMVDGAEVALVDLSGGRLRPFLARANLMGTIGDMAGPALVAAVAFTGLSWRAAFWVGAGLMAIYALALACSPLPAPHGHGAEDGHRPVRVLVEVARDRHVWMIGIMALLLGPFDEPLLAFTIALLERERGTSSGIATLVALIGVSGGLIVYTVLAAKLSPRTEVRAVVGAAVAMTAAVVVIATVPLVPLVAVAAFVVSIGLNLSWLALQHRSLTLRPGQAGSTQAVISTIEFAGFAIPVGIGAVADRAGLSVALLIYAVLGAVFAGLAAMFARSVARRARVGTQLA